MLATTVGPVSGVKSLDNLFSFPLLMVQDPVEIWQYFLSSAKKEAITRPGSAQLIRQLHCAVHVQPNITHASYPANIYCTVLFCTVLCCTVLYCTVLYHNFRRFVKVGFVKERLWHGDNTSGQLKRPPGFSIPTLTFMLNLEGMFLWVRADIVRSAIVHRESSWWRNFHFHSENLT